MQCLWRFLVFLGLVIWPIFLVSIAFCHPWYCGLFLTVFALKSRYYCCEQFDGQCIITLPWRQQCWFDNIEPPSGRNLTCTSLEKWSQRVFLAWKGNFVLPVKGAQRPNFSTDDRQWDKVYLFPSAQVLSLLFFSKVWKVNCTWELRSSLAVRYLN